MLESIIDIVRRAGELVRSANDVTAATHEKNGPADLVTEYDLAVQRFLRQELLALLPEADFFGEEGDHAALTRPWTFIVDPIDGTTNFVRGFAYTNISVALAKDGQVEYAVVYAPLAGELYAARRGGGATLNGRAIHVSGRDPGHSLVVCGSTIYDRSYTERHFAIMRYLYDRGLDYRRFGAAALDLCQVAAGRAEVFFECRLSPWDFAAGSRVVERVVFGVESDIRLQHIGTEPLEIFAEDRQLRHIFFVEVNAGAEGVSSEGFFHAGEQHLENYAVVFEFHFGFSRMDIHVYGVRIHFHEDEI